MIHYSLQESQEALPILREQRTLIEVLVEDSAANNTKYDQLLKRLECLDISDHVEKPETSGAVTLPQVNFNTYNLNQQPTELSVSANACNKIPDHRFLEIVDHSCLVSEIIQKIKAAQTQIKLELRNNLSERVLDVHWEEWSTLRGLYGEDALMRSFSQYGEVVGLETVVPDAKMLRLCVQVTVLESEDCEEHIQYTV